MTFMFHAAVFVATQLFLFFITFASKFCTLYFMVFEFLIPYQEKILPNARKMIKYKLVLDIYWELLR